MSKEELTIVHENGLVYLFTKDARGNPDWGVVLSPDSAKRAADVLRSAAARAVAPIIEAKAGAAIH